MATCGDNMAVGKTISQQLIIEVKKVESMINSQEYTAEYLPVVWKSKTTFCCWPGGRWNRNCLLFSFLSFKKSEDKTAEFCCSSKICNPSKVGSSKIVKGSDLSTKTEVSRSFWADKGCVALKKTRHKNVAQRPTGTDWGMLFIIKGFRLVKTAP